MILYAHLGSLWLGDDLYNLSRNYLHPGTGVDLFFCISGYVITRHLLDDLPSDRNWTSFVQFAIPFWIRRFWRLAPTAWLWLALMVGFSFLTDDAVLFHRTIYDAAVGFLQVANFHLYDCRIGLTQAVCGRIGYFWSLALEEHFYLLFPFMLIFLPRRALIAAMVIIILAQIGQARTALLWLIRTDALAFGILIALVEKSPIFRRLEPTCLARSAFFRWLLLAGLALIVCLEAPQFQLVSFPTGLVAIACAAVIWLACFGRGYVVPAGWLRNGLMLLGARSYALYIIHIPAAWFVSTSAEAALGHAPSAWFLAVAVPAALLVATELNYRFLEMPLRRIGVGIAARRAAVLDLRLNST